MSREAASTNFTGFDGMGRVKASTQKTETNPGVFTSYSFTYSYNRDGTLASQQYPSGKTVSVVYDRSGRNDPGWGVKILYSGSVPTFPTDR